MQTKSQIDIEHLFRSIVALLDSYGFPDDQPGNYRNKNSIGNRNLHGWHGEATSAIIALNAESRAATQSTSEE